MPIFALILPVTCDDDNYLGKALCLIGSKKGTSITTSTWVKVSANQLLALSLTGFSIARLIEYVVAMFTLIRGFTAITFEVIDIISNN